MWFIISARRPILKQLKLFKLTLGQGCKLLGLIWMVQSVKCVVINNYPNTLWKDSP